MPLVTGKTKLLGVIGNPVEHSLSPVMHNAAIAHLNIDYIYLPFRIEVQDLEKAIAGFEAIGVIGFNITIPHKQAIIPLLNEVSATAKMVGAVNTVWRKDGGWCGTNTDVEGFLAPLKMLSLDWQQVIPAILGNGGAARAVVVGCAELGCHQICVVGRDRVKLEQFKQSWGNLPFAAALTVHTWDELPGLVSKTKLLVNTTPVGMYPKINESPLEVEIMEKLPADAIAYDLIYTPNPTLFLKQAGNRIAIDGLEMLVRQGAAALKIWLQQDVPVDVMRRSLREYLRI
jgi:shikimate dehydrogenase